MADLPGFQRVENPGKRPYYLTKPRHPGEKPLVLDRGKEVAAYLQKEGITWLSASDFDFTRQTKRRKGASKHNVEPEGRTRASDIFGEDSTENQDEGGGQFKMMHLLASGVKLDHRALLEKAASELEALRQADGLDGPLLEKSDLSQLRAALSSAASLEEMVLLIGAADGGLMEMGRLVQDKCFEELLTLSAAEGPLPLQDWPNDRC